MTALPNPEELRGDLPADVKLEDLEWWRLGWYCQEAVLAQKAATRKSILEASGEQGDNGPLVDLDIRPFRFDRKGIPYLEVHFQGLPLLRVSLDRFLPGAPLRLDPMAGAFDPDDTSFTA